jgi:hypothetical protein
MKSRLVLKFPASSHSLSNSGIINTHHQAWPKLMFFFFWIKKFILNWAPVAHAYNPSYSGGRDQDCGSKLIPGK